MKEGVVARVISMLAAFADGEPALAVSQLSERLNLPPSSVHRLLEQLIKLDIIERGNYRRYRIGPEFIRMCMKAERKFRMVDIARPLMQKLSDELNETCVLSVLMKSRRQRLRVLTSDPSKQPLKLRARSQERYSLVWGAGGRVILAHMSKDEIKAAFDATAAASITGKPLFSYRWLLKELEQIRSKGFAVSYGELLSADSVAIGAPVFGPNQQILGAVAVIMPTFHFSEEMIEPVSTKVKQAATQISQLFGGGIQLIPEVNDYVDESLQVSRKTRSAKPLKKLPVRRSKSPVGGSRKLSKVFLTSAKPVSKLTH